MEKHVNGPDTPVSAAEVLRAVMEKVQGLGKHGENKAQGFKFRGIDDVMNAVGPALREAGGFIVPAVKAASHTTMTSAKGGVLNVVHLEVAYAIYGSDGSTILGSVAAEAFDSGDKATAKAMSVAYRTFLLQALCLPTNEPDPDEDSYELGDAAQMAEKARQALVGSLRKALSAKFPSDADAAREFVADKSGVTGVKLADLAIGELEAVEAALR